MGSWKSEVVFLRVGPSMTLPGPHILAVDDEASTREALTAALDTTYVVHTAATGGEACAILRAHPVAAIILDAVLGAEHGLDLVAPFRLLSPAPILLLTGHGSEELAGRAVWAGVNGYLKKPVSIPVQGMWVPGYDPLSRYAGK